MSRAISGAFRRALLLQESGEAIIAFLTIDHDDLAAPIRVASDGVDYSWQGEDWIGFPFKMHLLSDDEGAPKCQIEVQNVDRAIGDKLRALSSTARLRLDLVAASEFDQTADPRTPLGAPPVEYSANHLRLANVSVDAMMITGDVISRDYSQDSFPARLATQDKFPGLYR